MKIPMKVLAVLVVSVSLLAACSGGGGGGGGADAVTPAAYAKDVCGDVQGWVDEIMTLSNDFASSLDAAAPLEDQKAAVVAYLDDVVASTDQLITQVEDAGIPDVDDGQSVSDALIAAFEDARATLQGARDEVEGLSTDDGAAFGTELQTIGTDIEGSMNEIGSSLDSLSNEELDTAFQEEPACQNLASMA